MPTKLSTVSCSIVVNLVHLVGFSLFIYCSKYKIFSFMYISLFQFHFNKFPTMNMICFCNFFDSLEMKVIKIQNGLRQWFTITTIMTCNITMISFAYINSQ